jgi:hypothetical protein
MTFKNEISVGDLLTLAGLLIASIVLFLTWLSMRRHNRQKRAEFLIDLYNQYMADSDIMSIYYEIEYGQFEYNESFHQSESEKKLDKLLGIFENIAKLWEMDNITLEDVRIIAYEYIVVYQDHAVQEYLGFLDNWFRDRSIKVTPYAAFRRLGAKLLQQFYS